MAAPGPAEGKYAMSCPYCGGKVPAFAMRVEEGDPRQLTAASLAHLREVHGMTQYLDGRRL